VKLIGISSGVSYGALGSTHHSLHDLAALRAIHNIDIVVPADNFESVQAIQAAARQTRPIYVRFGKAMMYDLPRNNDEFRVGQARLIHPGQDIAFIATGETVIHALLAAERLKSNGVSARVVSMHSIKPLDAEAVLEAARSCRAVVTVEEHMTSGGLGDACASVIMEAGVCVAFKQIGIPDEYTVTGSQSDIFRHYGISMEGLTHIAEDLLLSR
jgi:transketolase